MTRSTVLVVDDEPAVRFTLKAILEEDGIDVVEAPDGEEALARLRGRDDIALVVTDLQMPRLGGMDLLAAVRELPRAPRVVVVTAHGSERAAVQAMKAGALDYFTKPFAADEIAAVVRRALATVRLEAENRELRARLTLGRTMVFESDAMLRVAEQVERVAQREVTVLVSGESGTGKELVARAIVLASPRKEWPYVRFNCAGLPHELAESELFGHRKGAFTGAAEARRGLFREAEGGTVLLDEVNALDPHAQGSLLRVLQEKEVRPVGEDRAQPVNVRVIAATNTDLEKAPGFRQDLYYRLNVVTLQLPPLRQRRDDVAPLARHFAQRIGEEFGLGPVEVTDRYLARLRDAPWPGNVRELEHTIRRGLALGTEPVLDGDPFDERPVPNPPPSGLRERVDAFEREVLVETLRVCQSNQSEAARRLGLSRSTLVDKLQKYGLR